jgi:alanine racemase
LILQKNKTFSWSFRRAEADVFVYKKRDGGPRHSIILQIQRKFYKLKIPFQDTASIENAISCLMALLYFDYDIATIQSRYCSCGNAIKSKNGINNCSLIDDSYSSDFQSLKIALDFLESQSNSQRRRSYFLIFSKVACPMRNCIPKFRNCF